MFPRRSLAALVLSCAVAVGGCGPTAETLKEPPPAPTEMQRRIAFCGALLAALTAFGNDDYEGAATAAERALDEAGSEVEPDLRTLHEAASAAEAGDASALEEPEVVAALDRLEDLATGYCERTP